MKNGFYELRRQRQSGEDCPYSIFEPFDLMISSFGNYECPLLGEDYDEYGQYNGHLVCEEKDYEKCIHFNNKKFLEGKIKSEE